VEAQVGKVTWSVDFHGTMVDRSAPVVLASPTFRRPAGTLRPGAEAAPTRPGGPTSWRGQREVGVVDEISFAKWVDAVEAHLGLFPIEPWVIAYREPTNLEAQLATAELRRRGHNVLVVPAKSIEITTSPAEPIYELFKQPDDKGEPKQWGSTRPSSS
jgi:hypothetical protein